MIRQVLGETESQFNPHWKRFFENMQLDCGFPLYDSFRLQWYNHFFQEFGENINLPILQMITQREKCYGNPARAMKLYKKYFKVSLIQKLKRAIELFSVARATRNL